MTPNRLRAFGSFWTPRTFGTRLKGWWHSDYGVWNDTGATTAAIVTGAVARWDDLSTVGRNLTQGTGANCPTLQVDAAGRRYLSFDGSNDYLRNGTASSVAQPATLAATGSVTAATTTLLDGGAVSEWNVFHSGTERAFFAGTGNVNNGTADNAVHVWRSFGSGADSVLAVDGATATGNAGASTLTGVTVGSRSDGTASGACAVYEVILISGTLAANETRRLERWLRRRRGVVLSY